MVIFGLDSIYRNTRYSYSNKAYFALAYSYMTLFVSTGYIGYVQNYSGNILTPRNRDSARHLTGEGPPMPSGTTNATRNNRKQVICLLHGLRHHRLEQRRDVLLAELQRVLEDALPVLLDHLGPRGTEE